MTGVRIVLITALLMGKAFAGVDPDFSRPSLSFIPAANDIIAAHNAIRSKVGVPPLAWSDELAQVAQQWANKLMIMGVFQHSTDDRYGENLFQISGPGASSNPYEVVNAWGAESAFYRYTDNKCSGLCGHYTQIVWRETKAVGCAVARDSQHEIWVCNYAPFGNIVGERPY
jgi:pathogenesis-related protein 1